MTVFNDKIRRYLNMAKEASKQSDFKQHHLGAVAIYKGSLLATGHNSTKTSPRQKEFNRERGWDVEDSKAHNTVRLYVYREHKNGVKALARPCPACQKMIKDMGIKEVWFTTENGFGYEWMED